jgi:hypothetical protein
MSRSESWPPDRFYWAVVDANGWNSAGPLPRGCAGALADEVPVPIEDLHAVCAPAGNGKLIVCAAEREAIQALDPETLSLGPSELPEGISGLAGLQSLELLTGEFEPLPIRRVRTRRRILALATVALCGGLVSYGLSRRAETWLDLSAQQRAAAVTLAASTIPSGDPDLLALEANRVRGRKSPKELSPAPDASIALAELLQIWPTEVGNKPQGITIAPTSMSCSVLVEGDPSPFLKALQAPRGWVLHEPRLNSSGAATRLTLHLTPEGAQR